MTEDPLWTILIATLASRTDKFTRLMNALLPQIEELPYAEVLACSNNGEWPLGEIRQKLLLSANGQYTSFLDDDDEIPPYFVREMLLALWEDPDSVGFNMQYFESDQFVAETFHSLRFEPHDEPGHLYRDLTHQQPVRSLIAKQGDFRLGWPEDNTWRNKVRPLLSVDKEIYIDKVMYYYKHSWTDSVQGNLAPHTYAPRPDIQSPFFRWIEMDSI